jgi:hypothetical protein
MTDASADSGSEQPAALPPPPPPSGQPAYPPAPYAGGYPPAPGFGAVGKVRGTGISILLFIVTLGIYGIVWYYLVHDEMKRNKGDGLGGGLALLLALLVGIVMPFITAGEVGELYARRGQEKPVTAVTGLWILLPLVGGIVWFVKTNGALNRYWESLGAR